MRKLIVCTVLLMTTMLHADESTKNEKLNELLNVMDMNALIDATYTQMENMMKGMSAQMNIKDSEQEIFDRHYTKMTTFLKEEMSWSKMQPSIVRIYSENFSEKEISDILEFYQTETGQSLLKKMPMVMQESMKISQDMVQKSMPKIQQLSMELQKELTEHRRSNQ